MHKSHGVSDLPSIFLLSALLYSLCLFGTHYAARLILWPLFTMVMQMANGTPFSWAMIEKHLFHVELPSLTHWFRHWFPYLIPMIGALAVIQSWTTTHPQHQRKLVLWVCYTVVSWNLIIAAIEQAVNLDRSLREYALEGLIMVRDTVWTLAGAWLALWLFPRVRQFLGRWFE